MSRLSRRSFLAASAALAAGRAIGADPAKAAAFNVVIIGAGAAGIAAARRIAAAGRRFALIEATDHVGGRCITDTRTFGLPFDRGAHWIHLSATNPLTRQRPPHGLDIYPAPASQKVRIGLRNAREGELEDFLAAQVRATRAIDDAARRADSAAEQALPSDLGDWKSSVEFVLGPFPFGKDLTRLSAIDFSRAAERRSDAFCRQGFGALLAAFATGIPVQLSTPATAVEIDRAVTVQTPKGTITGRAAILTASSNVIASGRIQFAPELPSRLRDAFAALSLGSYDHIALELAGNPLGLDSDDMVFEKSTDTHTATILGNVAGTPLCLLDVAGAFGRDLSARGEAAMVDFAVEWLAKLYGSAVRGAVRRAAATRWNSDPWTLGAGSAAAPGGAGARAILAEPWRDTLYFAGEAAHETLWGTVGGAWESGERAAEQVLQRLNGARNPESDQPKPRREREPLRRRRRRRRPRERRDE